MNAYPPRRGRPRNATIPHIYMAGKIEKNGWRHDLVPALRSINPGEGPHDCGSFVYRGPFFASCDHGCRHQPGAHGAAGERPCGEDITRASVFARNQAALDGADLVWAYIDAPECYGTVCEIAYAFCRGIPVYLHFAPGIDHNEFWYVARMTVGAPAISIVAREELPTVFRSFIAQWRRP